MAAWITTSASAIRFSAGSLTSASTRRPARISCRLSAPVTSYGYDAATGAYGDTYKFGIIDPAKVARTALLNAASVSGLALTTDVILTEMIERGHWCGETYFRNWKTEEAIPVSDTHFTIRAPGTGRALGFGTVINSAVVSHSTV